MAIMSGTFAALQQHHHYRRLWSGSMLATTAFMMSFMLVPSVAFEITGSNASAGLAQMGSGIGMLIVSPIGGVVADRFRKKPLVLLGQCLPALVILAVHSHGPKLTGQALKSQLQSYTGGCDSFIGSLPGGFAASQAEVPVAVGECSTIQVSPHAP